MSALPPQSTMKVSVHDRKVVQHFPHPLEWLALEGEEALRLGEALMERAWEARPDLKPISEDKKLEIMERQRRTLTQRLSVIFNSQREKRTVSNAELAKIVIDICFKVVY